MATANLDLSTASISKLKEMASMLNTEPEDGDDKRFAATWIDAIERKQLDDKHHESNQENWDAYYQSLHTDA